jgi:integrase
MGVTIKLDKQGKPVTAAIYAVRGNGERIYRRLQVPAAFRTASQAERWGWEEWARLRADGRTPPKAARSSKAKPTPTFQQFVEERWWPKYPAGKTQATIGGVEKLLRLYLKPALGPLKLTEITTEVVEHFLATVKRKRSKKDLSRKTVKHMRALLRMILAAAVRWEELGKLPDLPAVKVKQAPWDYLNSEESAKLLQAALTDDERTALLFALRTGARAGEQIALQWGDIDWMSRKVCFRRSMTYGVTGPTKSGKERRIPLSPELLHALKEHRLRVGGHEHVFCDGAGRALTLERLHSIVWGACRRAGLRKVRWHDLRHSFASQLVVANVPLARVQEYLGHSTITMTMRYAHLAPETAGAQLDVLDGTSVTVGSKPVAVRVGE